MLCIDGKFLIECLRAHTTRTKLPVPAIIIIITIIIFKSTNGMCESIPKPPYLSGIVRYEDDRALISPTHKRTEGRAPVWGSGFTSKDAAIQEGSEKLLLG